jgi:hypothetical protein
MDMTCEEARAALAKANTATETTRTVAALAGTDIVVMMWGLIWFVGFFWSHWVVLQQWPGVYHAIWYPLIALGIVVTIISEKRRSAPVKNAVGKRIGLFWWIMYGYCGLGMAILGNCMNQTVLYSSPEGAKSIAAINTIIPMFAYVVMGLWLEQNCFVYIGLGLTALTGLAYFCFNPVFLPFMAIAGGGVLFGSGLWMRVRWLGAMKRMEQHANA